MDLLARQAADGTDVVVHFTGALVALWANLHLLFVVALMWLVPDRRIERVVAGGRQSPEAR